MDGPKLAQARYVFMGQLKQYCETVRSNDLQPASSQVKQPLIKKGDIHTFNFNTNNKQRKKHNTMRRTNTIRMDKNKYTEEE